MKQSDSLELVAPGTLDRPGSIGRMVRLGMGVLCLYALWQVIIYREELIDTPVSVIPNFSVMLAIGLCIINYVVNIGFSKSWGRMPAYISLAAFGILAGVSYLVGGDWDSPILGVPLFMWLTYFYGHLGISFTIAAAIATPGCEMRSIPELLGRATGQKAQEHHCPAAFITKIDEWEKRIAVSSD
ncbi:MAG: hypothetical protein QGI68_17985 [Pseudomonadales bacterium]|mgnify:FL=1|jgi:hypothetical protein|nr:hypothetical protein [Pseudomonadales bacterium]MDP7358706.1 hypothetical protein [Pseudomonadales bacterium]MDP7597436.1 hypothetical protein [Pseudomonadales bacterium]HJN49252.1 hypothetical protein [Pseudomonadales bacterium]